MSSADLDPAAVSPRRTDIDGLRAVAVAAILLFHAAPKLAPGGYVGVDVFFVISGFLVTRLMDADRQAGRFSFARFYARRARRILPAYLAVIGLVTVAAFVFLMPREFRAFGYSLAASGLFLVNHLFARAGGYFEPMADQAPLLHLWSLAVEEQFYIVWPLLLALLSLPALRRGRLPAILLIAAGSLAAAQAMLGAGQGLAAFYLLPFRAWEFLLGAAVAFAARSPSDRRAEAAVAAGLLLIAGSAWGLSPGATFPGLAALPACLGTALVIWAGGATRLGAGLRTRPVVALGLISYSLYLWHWPLLVFGRMFLGRPLTIVEGLAIAAASLPLAWLTWRFVEQPWRKPAPRLRFAHLGLAVLSMAVLVGFGWQAFSTRGLPERLPAAVRQAAELEETDVNPQRETCHEASSKGGATPAACRPPGGAQVIVWGDSHADALYPGVAAWADAHGLAIQQSTMGGCPPLPGVRTVIVPSREREVCARFNASVLRDIATTPRLQVIVLIARWPLYAEAEPAYDINSPRVRIEDPAGPRGRPLSLDVALARTLAAIAATGTKARVIVAGPVPELTFNPPLCIAQSRRLGLDQRRCWSADARLPLTRVRAADVQVARALARYPGVATFRPAETLCVEGRCRVLENGRLLYFDDDHLSATAARAFVPGWLDGALGGS